MEKNKLMMIIIIVLLLVLLGTIVGVSLYTITITNGRAQEPVAGNIEETLAPDQITTYPIVQAFKTNLLQGADGEDHVISVMVSLAVSNVDKKENEALTKTLETSEDLIKSRVLRVIRDKTYEELSQGGASQQLLADDLLTVLQEAFSTDLIVEVFVSEMYVY